MTRLSVFAACLVPLWASASQPVAVGVVPFTNNSLADREAMQPLCRGLAEMMTTELGSISSLRLIERADLEKILAEMKLSMSGAVDEAELQEAGRLIGADLLLIGSFSNGFDGQIRIDARLVKVETGEAVKAEEVTGKKRNIFEMVKRLSFKMAQNLNARLGKDGESAAKGLGTDDFDALMCFSRGLDAEVKGDLSVAKALYEQAISIDRQFLMAKNRLEKLQGARSGQGRQD